LFPKIEDSFFTYSTAFKFYHSLGRIKDSHPAVQLTIKSQLSHEDVKNCGLNYEHSIEYAPKFFISSFNYLRSFGQWNINCYRTKQLPSYQARVFYGNLRSESENRPNYALFSVNSLDDFKVRIDQDGLPLFDKGISTNHEVSIPMVFPTLTDKLVLSDSLRFLMFYDLANSEFSYDSAFETSGVGLRVPFGGDVVGVGALTVSKLSIEVVLYSRIGNERSKKPRVLFDLSGKF
jgi:hypothetical protein